MVQNLQALHFVPTITKPTRFPPSNTNGNPSLLDHIWINCLDSYQCGILTTGVTDHCTTFIRLSLVFRQTELVKISFRIQSEHNKAKFVRRIQNENWNTTLADSIDNSTSSFVTKLNCIFRECFPLKTKFVFTKRLQKPWLTTGLLKSIKTKAVYFKLHRLGLIDNEHFKRFKNLLTSLLRKSKRNYYHALFDLRKNYIKKTWNTIRDLLSQNSTRKNIRSILINNVEVTDPEELANKFNDYFSTIAIELDSQIPPSNNSPLCNMAPSRQNSFFIYPVTLAECIDIISKLKNTSYGINNLPVKLLKYAKQSLAYPISKLINKSFEVGHFPACLKTACVTPVYKAGDSQAISNYRPISVLPLLSKIFERCMANRMLNYIDKYILLSPNQFGFRRKKSTLDALICLTEYIYNSLNDKSHAVSILVDLRKAFDTVNHQILLAKLHHYGFRGVALNWFRTYLSNRIQTVRIQDKISTPRTLNIGVPQGSILGPLLFLLYINDLPNVSEFSTILFADDTTLTTSHQHYPTLINNINLELVKIRNWLINNRLSLNIDKTYMMVFTNRSQEVNNDGDLDVKISYPSQPS